MNCDSCGAVPVDGARFCSACGASVRRETAGDPLRDALQKAMPAHLQIVRPLGRGGMGAVYLARDEFLDREVAIKTMPAGISDDGAFRERFRREARIAAKLHHPNIVPLHSFGEGEGILYYVMGYVRGETLAQRLDREKTMTAEETRRILAEIAEALRHAAAQSIIHRDLKPANILLDDSTGAAVLADFGIARISGSSGLTSAGAVIGTPLYMAPEQATGASVDQRSDLYSLGVIGYRMLTGRFPVGGETFAEMVAQHTAATPDRIDRINPSVPQDLSDALMRCLEKNPDARWQNAAELREALAPAADAAAEPESNMRGLGFYALIFLWIAVLLLPFELFLWRDIDPGWRLIIEALQVVPLSLCMLLGVRMFEARKKRGAPWPSIVRDAFHPPRWYAGWVPRAWRPAGDLWQRLPRPVRAYRTTFTVTLLCGSVAAVAIPLFILWPVPRTITVAFAGVLIAVMLSSAVVAVFAELALKKIGLGTADRSVAMHRASWLLAKSTAVRNALTGSRPASESTVALAVADEATVAKE